MKKVLLPSQELAVYDITHSFDIENLPDAVIAVDAKGQILVWNKAAERLYGWKKSEALGKKETELLKSRLLNSTIDAYRDIIRAKGQWEGEIVQYKKDGTRIFVLSSIRQIRNSKDGLIGTIGFNKDITTHKHIEYNLRFLSGAVKAFSSSLDYRTTLQKVAQLAVPRIADWCVIDLVKDGTTLENIAVIHKDPKKVKWARLVRKQYPSNIKDTTSGLGKVIQNGTSELYSYIPDKAIAQAAKNPRHLALLRKIGFTSVIMVPIMAHKKTIGAITLVSSESRRHYTQLDLETAEKLSSRASIAVENSLLYQNASHEIEERKQIEARLREMESRKDNFISMASHELKTPVTSLKIYRDLLERQLTEKGHKEFSKMLAVMENQIHKLGTLIADLLNISKIQAGKLDFRMDNFNIIQLIKETVHELSATTDHTIEIKVKNAEIIVYGDRERLSQVLINLITNAIKYSPDGKKIIIRAERNDHDIRVIIRDFGIGIKKEEEQKIFERFYQVEKDDTYPGLGMGLYISQEIISRHKGKIWVEKARGKGSVFIFTLPLS
ncbi:PAS domain-containing sensor histidine kinase [Candidatus Parcubacteria bacterium]|nr:PAS domain-containing sensor histidine kinase [Candidatus Parcubacteria bacterium]